MKKRILQVRLPQTKDMQYMVGDLGKGLKLLHCTGELEAVSHINFSEPKICLQLPDLVFQPDAVIVYVALKYKHFFVCHKDSPHSSP